MSYARALFFSLRHVHERHFVCRCTKHLNPPVLYQMSVTLPARVTLSPLWIRIVLPTPATWMSIRWSKSMNTMWVPAVPLPPLVMAALDGPSKPMYEMNAAFGVVIDCLAFATTTEVMMATTVANRMTAGREDFCILTSRGITASWSSSLLNSRPFVDSKMPFAT